MEQFGMYAYNFDLKISGNMVSIRKYDNTQLKNNLKAKSDTKNVRVDKEDKTVKNILIEYKKWYGRKKEKVSKSIYKEFLTTQGIYSRLIQRIEELKRRERFYRSNSRAKTKIIDLIACNHKKIKKYDGKKPKTTKFLTLTFEDLNVGSDIKKANAELTKFMKRLSYNLYGVKKNVIKYIAIPETHAKGMSDKKSRWHFHLVLFNVEYVKQDTLQKIWKNGILDIRALKGSASKVAKYVGKYLGKSHKKIKNKKNGKSKMVFGGETDKIYTYEKYKRLGLENMKRYSCSRGLRRAKKYSINLDEQEYKKIWTGIFNAEFLTNKCNKINDLEKTEKYKSIDNETGELKYELYKNNKINCKKIHGTERGSITYIDFEIKEKYLKDFIDRYRHLTLLKMDKMKIKKKSINHLLNFISDIDWELFVEKVA